MEYKFNHLVTTKITRLTRPYIAFTGGIMDSLISPTDSILTQESDELVCSNDIAEKSSEFDSMFHFNTKFG